MNQYIGKILFGLILVLTVVTGFIYIAGKAAPRADINNPQTCWWEGVTPNLKQVCVDADPDVQNQQEQYNQLYDQCVNNGGKPDDCATNAACTMINQGYAYSVGCETAAPVVGVIPSDGTPSNYDDSTKKCLENPNSPVFGKGDFKTCSDKVQYEECKKTGGNEFQCKSIIGYEPASSRTSAHISSSSGEQEGSEDSGESQSLNGSTESGQASSDIKSSDGGSSSVGSSLSSGSVDESVGTSGSTLGSGATSGQETLIQPLHPDVWDRIVGFFRALFSFGN